jgi:hypothetical protein
MNTLRTNIRRRDTPTTIFAGTADTGFAIRGRAIPRFPPSWSSLSTPAPDRQRRRFVVLSRPSACCAPGVPWPCGNRCSHPDNEAGAGNCLRWRRHAPSRSFECGWRQTSRHIHLPPGLVPQDRRGKDRAGRSGAAGRQPGEPQAPAPAWVCGSRWDAAGKKRSRASPTRQSCPAPRLRGRESGAWRSTEFRVHRSATMRRSWSRARPKHARLKHARPIRAKPTRRNCGCSLSLRTIRRNVLHPSWTRPRNRRGIRLRRFHHRLRTSAARTQPSTARPQLLVPNGIAP